MKRKVFILLLVSILALAGCGRQKQTALVSTDSGITITAAIASNRDTKGWDGQEELYLLQGDPSNLVRITSNGAWDRQPAWSPDRSKIAFVSDRNDRSMELYVMDVAEALQFVKDNPKETSARNKVPGKDTPVIRVTSNGGPNYHPAWSPDGSRIVFESHQTGNAEIFVVNADGTNPVNLTDNQAFDYQPAWSPDGSKIVFASKERDSFYAQIYVMDADGSNVRRLSNQSSPDYAPMWSPDGSKIVFYSYRDGSPEIYVMNADGSNPVRLTNNDAYDKDPVWSSNGARIMFASNRDGRAGLYVMKADGSDVLRVTDSAADYYDPAWAW